VALGVDVCECCGREFELPLRLTVLSEEPKETYLVCPFCFTRVEEEARTEAVPRPLVDKKQERPRGKVKAGAVEAGVGRCGHRFGYLKGRAKNAAIPDECLVCPKILECMI